MPHKSIMQFADVAGDATGLTSGVGDFSTTPRELKINPPAGHKYEIHRMVVHIEDVGAPDSGKYGNNIVLTNGIKVAVQRNGADYLVLTDAAPVMTNADWAKFCYDVHVLSFGLGNTIVAVRWSFDKSGSPVVLSNAHDEQLVVTLNDDFSGLVEHKFHIQGEDFFR